MDYERWQAKVVDRIDMMAFAVYLTRRIGKTRYYLTPKGEVEAKEGTVIKDDPFFCILEPDQLQALGIAINNAGYQAPNEHLIEGKLVATEKHLEDMRSLVFKGKKNAEG